MSNVLYIDDEETTNKIDIDELYEKSMKREIKHLSIFNKILNRIHKRITVTAKNKQHDKFVWFIIPTYIFGESTYDQGECIAHIIKELTNNGFYVKYLHPNTIFVSWENWIPSYVRSEYKKKTGNIINEKGQVLNPEINDENKETHDTKLLFGSTTKEQKNYTPIGKYTPTGNLVYNANLFKAVSGNNG